MNRIRFNSELCTGCCACQMACLDQRDIDCAAGQKPLRFMASRVTDGRLIWKSIGCVHCGTCMRVCPTGALCRDPESGYVLLEEARCVGCGACISACPLQVISTRPADGRSMKCDGCLGRVGAGLLPACVHTCPTGALSFSRE